MTEARDELDVDDSFVLIINSQLANLRQDFSRAKCMAPLSLTPNFPLRDVAADSAENCSPTIPLTEHSKTISKYPKTTSQIVEEMQTCITELRHWVDTLTSSREEQYRELTEERSKRLAAEAELIASRIYYPPVSTSHQLSENLYEVTSSPLERLPSSSESTMDYPDSFSEGAEQLERWYDAAGR